MGMLVVFASLGLGRFAYALVLPSMQTALGMDNTQAGTLATANMAGYFAFSLIGGALAAYFGPRLVIACGLGLAAFAMIMTGFAGSFGAAAFWRALVGIGSGAGNIPAMGLIATWFASRRRGLAAGIAVAGSSLGLIVTGPIAPRILAAYGESGWRVCWFAFGGAALLLAVAAGFIVRNRPSDVGLHPVGETPEDRVAAAGAVSRRWSEVFTTANVYLLGIVYVAFGFSYIIYMTFFSKVLTDYRGYTPEKAGQLFMTMGWLSLGCGILWGSLSDRIGRKRALAIVYAIQAVAYGLFALWPAPAGCTLSAILFGLTAWSIPGIVAAACGDLLGAKLAPAALGFVTLFFGVGQVAGPRVAGQMADAYGSFGPAFLAAAGVALLGAIGSLLLPLKHVHHDG
jgi:sugar phosphate permease